MKQILDFQDRLSDLKDPSLYYNLNDQYLKTFKYESLQYLALIIQTSRYYISYSTPLQIYWCQNSFCICDLPKSQYQSVLKRAVCYSNTKLAHSLHRSHTIFILVVGFGLWRDQEHSEIQSVPVTEPSNNQYNISQSIQHRLYSSIHLNPYYQYLKTQKNQPYMQKARSPELLFKIIVIGESATGKSSLLLRYVKQQFKSQYSVTVGVQFASKIIPVDDTQNIKLQIWDTAGQQSYRSIVRNFYRNTSAVFLVYDITKRKTFGALNGWLKQAKQNSPKNVMFVLIGTHLDAIESDPSKRQVSREEAQRWMFSQGVNLFFQTSSKSNCNVDEAFKQTADQLFLSHMRSRKNSASLLQTMMQISPQFKQSAKENTRCC